MEYALISISWKSKQENQVENGWRMCSTVVVIIKNVGLAVFSIRDLIITLLPYPSYSMIAIID